MSHIGNQTQYAKHAGISRAAVSKAIKAGRIPTLPDGKINFAAADLAREENTTPARLNKPANGQGEEARPQNSFSASRADREGYEAELARLRVERELGKVLDRQAVEDAMVASGRTIRQGLDGIVTWADELDAAARSGGSAAVRAVLKERVRDLESMIADKMNLLVGDDGQD